jgi:iron(III) transport system substrate-binding protein
MKSRGAVLVGATVALFAAVAPAWAEERTVFAVNDPREMLTIHAATDLPVMAPLIRDFQVLNPGTAVTYVEYVTNDLYAAAFAACRRGTAIGDILLSSAVHHLVKLANDGCATSVPSAQTARLPRGANWRDEVFGFTFEPAVIVYNRAKVPVEDVPQTHLELADLLRLKADTYRGLVGTYDIRQSGIGYLLAFNDSRQTSTTYGRLLESLGRSRAVVRCCTTEILDELVAGRLLIGYNMLASYAYARMREGAELGIVLPTDYTLVLSRGAMVPRHSPAPAVAARFLDYLLSDRGRETARREAFFFGLDGEPPPAEHGLPVTGATSLAKSGVARPIAISPVLLAVQDDERRRRFIGDWTRSLVDMAKEEGP